MIAPTAAVVAIAQYGNCSMWWLLRYWGDDEKGFFVDEAYVTLADGAKEVDEGCKGVSVRVTEAE